MMSVPKVAFDAIHQVVMQLSKSLDEMAQGVNKQAVGIAAGAGESKNASAATTSAAGPT